MLKCGSFGIIVIWLLVRLSDQDGSHAPLFVRYSGHMRLAGNPRLILNMLVGLQVTSHLAGDYLGIPQKELEDVAGQKGWVGCVLSLVCLRKPNPGKALNYVGGMWASWWSGSVPLTHTHIHSSTVQKLSVNSCRGSTHNKQRCRNDAILQRWKRWWVCKVDYDQPLRQYSNFDKYTVRENKQHEPPMTERRHVSIKLKTYTVLFFSLWCLCKKMTSR